MKDPVSRAFVRYWPRRVPVLMGPAMLLGCLLGFFWWTEGVEQVSAQGMEPVVPGIQQKKARRGGQPTLSSDPLVRCASLHKGTIRSAFQELQCLISWRRSARVRNHRVDPVIRQRFRQLHSMLRTSAKDWRIVHRWQALYRLGTKMYPLENRWAANANMPVYEVNGHHKSMPFWVKEALRRKVGPLLHLDAHADMADVPSFKKVLKAIDKLRHNRDTRSAWHTIAHSIRDCAMPVTGGVLAGAYKRVIWGLPGWVQEPTFVNRRFFFASSYDVLPGSKGRAGWRGRARRRSGSWQMTPLLRSLPPVSSRRSPVSPLVWGHGARVVPHGSRRLRGNEVGQGRTYLPERWPGAFRLYYDPNDTRAGRKPLTKGGIYWQKVTAKKRPHRRHFTAIRRFLFSILKTDLEIGKKGKGPGAKTARKLLKAIPEGPFTLDLDLDYFASIDSARSFRRGAGEPPHWPLSTFQQQRKILDRRLLRFRHLLLFLKRHNRLPALVTIADSTFFNFALDPVAEGQSEYAPLEHAAYLRKEVRELLRDIYGRDVDGRSCMRPPTFSAATLPPIKSASRRAPSHPTAR